MKNEELLRRKNANTLKFKECKLQRIKTKTNSKDNYKTITFRYIYILTK